MPLLVCAATGIELSAVLGAPFAAGQGRVVAALAHGREVLALATGVGMLNAGLALGRALAGAERIDGVLNLGLAGSFDLEAHPLRAARLVTAETWPEYGLLFSGAVDADARALRLPLCGGGEAAVWDRLELDPAGALARMGLAAPDVPGATSLTVSGVSADAELARRRRARHGADLENMEGFALAYGAGQAGLPFAQLRVVCNAVGSRPPERWDIPGALTALGRAACGLLAQTPAATPG